MYGLVEYFTNIWDIFGPFGTFCVHLVHYFPALVSCTKKNLATLAPPLRFCGFSFPAKNVPFS
jgi:hypothetical protein